MTLIRNTDGLKLFGSVLWMSRENTRSTEGQNMRGYFKVILVGTGGMRIKELMALNLQGS